MSTATLAGVVLTNGAIEAAKGIGLTPSGTNPNAGKANEASTLWVHDDGVLHRPALGAQHLALFLRKLKAGDTARTDNTLAMDPDLVVNVGAGRRYIIEARLRINESVTATGFNCGFDGTCTISDYDCSYSDAGLAGDLNYASEFANIADAKNHANAAGGDGLILLNGNLLVSGAGTFGIRWARNSAITGTATLRKGSWLKLTEVS